MITRFILLDEYCEFGRGNMALYAEVPAEVINFIQHFQWDLIRRCNLRRQITENDFAIFEDKKMTKEKNRNLKCQKHKVCSTKTI